MQNRLLLRFIQSKRSFKRLLAGRNSVHSSAVMKLSRCEGATFSWLTEEKVRRKIRQSVCLWELRRSIQMYSNRWLTVQKSKILSFSFPLIQQQKPTGWKLASRRSLPLRFQSFHFRDVEASNRICLTLRKIIYRNRFEDVFTSFRVFHHIYKELA